MLSVVTSPIILNVIMLSVVMLSVVMLSVVALLIIRIFAYFAEAVLAGIEPSTLGWRGECCTTVLTCSPANPASKIMSVCVNINCYW